MASKILAGVLLVSGCVAAAGAGAFLAVRQNAVDQPVAAAPATTGSPAGQPAVAVAETEAVLAPPSPAPAAPAPGVDREDTGNEPIERARPEPRPRPQARRTAAPVAPAEAPVPSREAERREAGPAPEPAATAPVVTAAPPEIPRPEPAPLPPLVLFEDVVVPASSVIGLRVETALTSERARVEDRVEARVARDVTADGRVAIPAGARAIGTVTLVERGGKMKERARLGVRFHTLVLSDGREVPISTDAVFREGDSPSGESARKIGGAAAGGAILGALLGGKKGAVVGGAAGAGAGTAAVMAGDRNAATIPSGTVLTVRLVSPVSVEVEKR